MKSILGICTATLILALAGTLAMPAQTITPDQATLRLFPREANGIAVLDVAALRNSQLFQEYIANPNYPGDVRRLIDATGFTPDRDIDLMTVAKVGRQDFVAVVRARYDRFKMEQYLQGEGRQTETYLGRLLYLPNRDDSGGRGMTLSFIDDMILVGNHEAVKQVIDRVAAPAQSALDNTALMDSLRVVEAGSQIWGVGEFDLESMPGRARVPGPVAQFAQNLRTGSYQMRLDTGVHVKAVGNFINDEAAQSTAEVLRGLVAIARMQLAPQRDDLLPVLDGLQIDNSGSSITLRFDGEGEVLKMLPRIRRRVAAE